MLSLRSLARASPRNTSRLSTVAARSVQRAAPVQTAFKAAAPRFTAAFSTSRAHFEANEELAAKLNSEIVFERDQEDSHRERFIKEYLDNSEFQIEDIPGQEEVNSTRTYGDEQIKVTFSIADFNAMDPEAEEEDPALYDEDDNPMDMDGQSGGANTKGAINQGRTNGGNIKMTTEDDVSPADRPESADEEDQGQNFPARVQVTVTRGDKGASAIECIAQDGEMTIDNVYYFPSAESADAKSAEKDWERRSLYTGPPFGQLDEQLQVSLERYLDDRGINTSMASFIPDYIDMKEQKEYSNWLEKMKDFVE